MIDTLKPLVKQFMPFAQERMGFNKPPRLFLRQDEDNARNPLGKTAYYDPDQMSVTLYISGRHPKDIMRSLSHELVHHTQNCNGMFNDVGEMGEGYAQNDEHLREMEREAYEQGNLCFRDWEDGIRDTIYFEHLQKGAKTKMSTKKWKNNELKGLLTEKWGFQMDLSKLNEEVTDEEPVVEEELDEGCPGSEPMPPMAGEVEVVDDMAVAEEPEALISNIRDLLAQLEGSMGAAPMDEPMMDDHDHPMMEGEDEEELEEGGAAARTGNEDKDPGRHRMHADRVHEAVVRQRIRKILKNVKFKK